MYKIAEWEWKIKRENQKLIDIVRDIFSIHEYIYSVIPSIETYGVEVDYEPCSQDSLKDCLESYESGDSIEDILCLSFKVKSGKMDLMSISMFGMIETEEFSEAYLNIKTYSDIWMKEDVYGNKNNEYAEYSRYLEKIILKISSMAEIQSEEVKGSPLSINKVTSLENFQTLKEAGL